MNNKKEVIIVDEHCQSCDKDVVLEVHHTQEAMICPNCGHPILPCSLCTDDMYKLCNICEERLFKKKK